MIKTLTLTLLLLATGAGADTAPAPRSAQPLLLVLGDSISAAYGMPVEYGWVKLLDEVLQQRGLASTVVNASISGETTSGGLARLPALLDQYAVDTLIIELGGNNGLRGQPLSMMRDDLRQMIQLGQAHGAKVLLIGMHIPPNYGKKYAQRFHQSFADVAKQEDAALVPFLLAGFATEDGMIQDDGIHPSAAAQPLMLDNVLPHLLPLLSAVPTSVKQTPDSNDQASDHSGSNTQ